MFFSFNLWMDLGEWYSRVYVETLLIIFERHFLYNKVHSFLLSQILLPQYRKTQCHSQFMPALASVGEHEASSSRLIVKRLWHPPRVAVLEFTAYHDDVPTRGYYFDKLFSPVDYGLPCHAGWVFIAYGESPRDLSIRIYILRLWWSFKEKYTTDSRNELFLYLKINCVPNCNLLLLFNLYINFTRMFLTRNLGFECIFLFFLTFLCDSGVITVKR